MWPHESFLQTHLLLEVVIIIASIFWAEDGDSFSIYTLLVLAGMGVSYKEELHVREDVFNEEEQFKQKGDDGASYVHSNIQGEQEIYLSKR